MKDIAVYGAGGFGREIACLINLINEKEGLWNFIGFFDDGIAKGSKNEYGVILGGIEELNRWDKELAISVAIGSPGVLKKVVTDITNPAISFPNIISPDLVLIDKKSFRLGKGNIIHLKCFISCNVEVGDFNVVNENVTIGHDNSIGSFNVVMPYVKISGDVKIGDGNFFGLSSAILQQIKIGNGVRVGAGSIVIRKTQDNSLYVGNPAVKMEF